MCCALHESIPKDPVLESSQLGGSSPAPSALGDHSLLFPELRIPRRAELSAELELMGCPALGCHSSLGAGLVFPAGSSGGLFPVLLGILCFPRL